MQSHTPSSQQFRYIDDLMRAETLLQIEPVAYFTIFPGAAEEFYLYLGADRQGAATESHDPRNKFRTEALSLNPKGDALSPLPLARPLGASIRSFIGNIVSYISPRSRQLDRSAH